jgi:hypothetical protein
VTIPTPTPHVLKRLAFVRLLYQQGVEQSHQPAPLSYMCLLSLHDAAELFMVLTGDHLRASTVGRETKFLDYFKALAPSKTAPGPGVQLSGAHGMRRLNEARNNLKHAGGTPDPETIERARADVTAFLEENTQRVFLLPFSDIDMADLMPQPEARTMVKEAVTVRRSGDAAEAMALLSEAFSELFEEHVQPSEHWSSRYSFGPSIERNSHTTTHRWRSLLTSLSSSGSRWSSAADSLSKDIGPLFETVARLQSGMRVVALGLAYHEYDRFQHLVPRVHKQPDGQWFVMHPRPGYEPDQEEFDFCRQFVISFALRLGQVAAHTRAASWEDEDV